MRAQDLILLAGGFKEGASLQRVEIARRLNAKDAATDQTAYAIVKAIDISNNSNTEDLNFILAPFDIVSIRKAPNYKVSNDKKIEQAQHERKRLNEFSQQWKCIINILSIQLCEQ
jgi:protein involved in polysaccharide export with SLBB domain